MRAKIRDTELYFDVDGLGLVIDGNGAREHRPAFLLNGGPGIDHTGMKMGFGRFSDRLQLIYHDYRGHGRSAAGDPARYTLDEHVEDLEALRRHLGTGPIVSVGVSYGGEVAMAHAARYPDAVSHLVIITAVAHGGNAARATENVRARGTPEQVEQCELFYAGEVASLDRIRRFLTVMTPLYTMHSIDTAAAAYLAERTPISLDGWRSAHARGGFQQAVDLRPELGRITARTLVIAGRHDPMCPPDFSEEIHRLIPGSKLQIFESSSHLVAMDEPQRFHDALSAFLADDLEG